MTQVLTGQHDIQDLFREVIVDDGNGQPAVLTTLTAPAPAMFVVGVGEDTFVLDQVTNSSETNHTVNPYAEESVVTVSDSVQMLIQDYSPLVSDLEYVSESITVHIPIPGNITPVFDAVTNTENVNVTQYDWIHFLSLSDAVSSTESVTAEIVGP